LKDSQKSITLSVRRRRKKHRLVVEVESLCRLGKKYKKSTNFQYVAYFIISDKN